MKLNRRNTIIGLGTVVLGGGAALGSGAFSTAEATRDVEVNVVTDEDIAADLVDVLIQDPDRWDSVEIDGEDDADGLFPTDDDDLDDADAADVSLIQNDVTIIFGPADNELPPNFTVNYGDEDEDGFFKIINDGDGDDDFDVTLSFDASEGNSFEFGGDTEYSETVEEGESEEVDLTLETGDDSDEGAELTITIEEA